MEKQDVQQRLWTQVFALWSPSGAAGDCEETSHGWKRNVTIHSNRKLMRGLSCFVVCWVAVSSMPRMVSPAKSRAKLLSFSTCAGLPITFIKHSSSYKGLSAVPVQSPKHLFYLWFPLPANTPKQEKSYSQTQWEPSAQEECPHAC